MHSTLGFEQMFENEINEMHFCNLISKLLLQTITNFEGKNFETSLKKDTVCA